MSKTKMLAFRIEEISGVDRPAQVGARVAIMKREDPAIGKRAVLTTATEGHTHLVQTYESLSGDTSWVDEHTHPWILNENGTIKVGEARGHSHEIDELTMTKKIPANPETAMPTKKPDDNAVTEAAKAHEEEIVKLTARAERAEKLATLSDDQKALIAKMDAEAQDGFLALEPEARVALVAKAAEENAVVYTAKDGTEYRKSDDARLVALAKSADDERAKRVATEDAAATVTLKAQADEFAHLPGTLETRMAILKGVNSLDEEPRKAALESLKAQDTELAEAFKRAGTSAAPSKDDPLEAIAKKLRDADPKLPKEQSVADALNTPEGAAAYAKSVGL